MASSQIEEFVRMLDEKKVKYDVVDNEHVKGIVFFKTPNKQQANYSHYLDGHTHVGIWDCTPEQAIAATLGRSCASCPEMDNPDSYIAHLQSALEWHDEHVPRPTNPKNTCVVLKGKNKPDEVLFIHDEGGVTHYLPEDAGTCHGSFHKSSDLSSGRVSLYYCKDTNRSIFVEREAKVCPLCGGRIKEEAE